MEQVRAMTTEWLGKASQKNHRYPHVIEVGGCIWEVKEK